MLEVAKTPLIIATGPAGTGKTMMPYITGQKHVINNKYDKVIITRPLISISSESIGHLPGTLEQKTNPWMSHMLDYCPFPNQIETVPLYSLEVLHGTTRVIIADEMQNSTPTQMQSILTRLGKTPPLS